MNALEQLAELWPLLGGMVIQTVLLAKANAVRLEAVERAVTRAHRRIDDLIDAKR